MKAIIILLLMVSWLKCQEATNSLESSNLKKLIVSQSGQFQLIGENQALSTSISTEAEELKADLLDLLGIKDTWKNKVIIELHGKEGDSVPASTVIAQLLIQDQVFQFKIHVHVGKGIDQAVFQQELLSVILFELYLQKNPQVDETKQLRVPLWIYMGILEALEWKKDLGDYEIYQHIFRHGSLFKLEDLFKKDKQQFEMMDPASQKIFRASCGAMLMTLLNQSEGVQLLRDFISESLTFFGDTPQLLRQFFPSLNLSENSLSKWWQLQLANKSLAPLRDSMSVEETEQMLSKALMVSYTNEKQEVISEDVTQSWFIIQQLDKTQRLQIFKKLNEALVLLSYRCFPSFRPILKEYIHLFEPLSQEKTSTQEKRFVLLKQQREDFVQKSERARSYLDWFEITRAQTTSSTFDDYLSFKENSQQKRKTRSDSITKYLDQVDALFDR